MVSDRELRLAAAALNRLEQQERRDSFDPNRPGSRPTKAQQEIIDDFFDSPISNLFLLGGNQCLVEGTQVLTTAGIKAIQDIVVGDRVFDENGMPIDVVKVHSNGRKRVGKITYRNIEMAECTENHVFLVEDGHGRMHERAAKNFKRDDRIVRKIIKMDSSCLNIKEAYVLGAMLGDGCSRESRLSISSCDDKIPTYIASILGCNFKRNSEHNYTWNFDYNKRIPFYYEWCRDRYAHEKIIDIEEIKKWDRESLVALVAGVYDTDGSLTHIKDICSLSITMQAKSVLEAMEYCFLYLWQTQVQWHIDNRTKYKNGPCYSITVKNPWNVKLILEELNKHIQSEQKKWNDSILEKCGKRSQLDRVGAKFTLTDKVVNTYDITVASRTNLYCLANGLVTHNSGKSVLSLYIIAQIFNGYRKLEQWNTLADPQILILSRTGKQIEESLWPKLRPFLEPGSYKAIRQGNVLQAIHSTKSGASIVFQSYENEALACERAQSYTAHVVMVDEMPRTKKLIEEVQRRVTMNNGKLMMAFTPKIVSREVREVVDNAKLPHGKKYFLKMFDNPSITEEIKERTLAELAAHSEAYRKTILEGAWTSEGNLVYYIDQELTIQAPDGYNAAWRHCEFSDPALDSIHGLVIAAEDPNTGIWYIVRTEYVSGILVPSKLVDHILNLTRQYNIVRRIADPAATWYIHTAHEKGATYIGPHEKNNRRDEMITNMQEALGRKVRIAPWCTDLLDEFSTYHWSEKGNGKIANADKYHLLDALRYGIDCLPAGEPIPVFKPWHQELREANTKRKAIEESHKNGITRGGRIQRRGVWGRTYR